MIQVTGSWQNYKEITLCQVEAGNSTRDQWVSTNVILNMGLIQLPELEDYWKSLFAREIPFFGHVLPQHCSEAIFWMLHVSHTAPGQRIKKKNKVQLLLDHLSSSSFRPITTLSKTFPCMIRWLVSEGVSLPSSICPRSQPNGASKPSQWPIAEAGTCPTFSCTLAKKCWRVLLQNTVIFCSLLKW